VPDICLVVLYRPWILFVQRLFFLLAPILSFVQVLLRLLLLRLLPVLRCMDVRDPRSGHAKSDKPRNVTSLLFMLRRGQGKPDSLRSWLTPHACERCRGRTYTSALSRCDRRPSGPRHPNRPV
jgi:hypothetical protein